MNGEAVSLVLRELSRAGVSAETEQMLERLEGRRVTAERELPRMEFLFRLFHKPCFPRGELVALSGKAKSGKTFVSSILMTLCLRSPVLSLERIEPRRLRVLWYDTEQSEESTQDILRNRILRMATDALDLRSLATEGTQEHGLTRDWEQLLDVFNVRGEMFAERLPLLEAAVRHYRPDLVIVDGIRDLVADINDGVVAQDTIERLMRLASDVRCCIACVLHQNKAVEDRNLRGWIGTELKNKAFEVYECAKSSERIFSWSQTDTRKYDIDQALQFAVSDDGLPYLCTPEQLLEAQYNAQRKAAAQMQRSGKGAGKLPEFNPRYVLGKENRKTVFNLRLLFADCMEAGRTYREDELKQIVGVTANILKDNVYREQVERAVREGVIMQSYDGCQRRIYLRPVVQTEIDFK